MPDSDDAVIAEGSWRGSIAQQRIGEGGFGYDPVFIDNELGVSAAQLSAEEKNQRSHRGKALAELARLLGAR
jgi:XTP/dITP diphosphohydrolase